MTVLHVVLLGFKPDTAPEAIQQCCADMLDLKNICVSAASGQPYIKSSRGGKDISIEGLQDGLTHAFVVEFDSEADRDFYVKQDKAHHAFVEKWFKAKDAPLGKAAVLDFVPGAF